MRPTLTSCIACLAGLVSFVSLGAQTSALDRLLDSATATVEDFVSKFSRVVAEEQYLQEFLTSGPEGTFGRFQGSPQVRDRRRLLSDLLLVKLPETGEWHVFRDVFEADGRPVRDRNDTIAKLFLESQDTSTALKKAREVAAASARFNVGPMGTFDHPFLALAFLQRDYRNRFRFTLRGLDPTLASDARIVEFQETARPTIIRATGDRNVVARGRYWISEATGRILKTELMLNVLANESSTIARFEYDDHFGTQMPVEMRFRQATMTTEIRGTATYGRFRQFEVVTKAIPR